MIQRLPVLFIGHGSPMYAIEDNAFTRKLSELGRRIPRPKVILCISAHWMTEGTWVTHMSKPKTIHDFYGFPQALFDVEYPAPGSPETADLIRDVVKAPVVHTDDEMWGLDHGTWAVLKHMYPRAEVPVLQMSVYMEMPAEYHFNIGERLRFLRDQGVLIIGSGNIVHNLRVIDFENRSSAFGWAIEFDEWVKERMVSRDYRSIMTEATTSKAGKLSVPTPDHWYPVFYTLGAADHNDHLQFEYEGIENGSISMRCFSMGLASEPS